MKLINLTPHPIQIWNENKCVLTIEPQGKPARCEEIKGNEFNMYVDKIPVRIVNNLSYSAADLPPSQPGVIYIVSVLVAQSSNRKDLMIPYDLVRSEQGQIIGCRSLAMIQ